MNISTNQLSNQEITLETLQLEIKDLKEKLEVAMVKDQELQRYKSVVDVSSDGFWEWTINENTIYYSEKCRISLGYELDELVKVELKEWENLVHPDDAMMVFQKLRNYVEKQSEKHRSEYRIRTKQGEYIWILDEGAITAWDEYGKPTKMIGIHKLIEDRKKTEEQLYRTDKLYRSLIEASPDSITITDLQGKIVERSTKSHKIFGYDPSNDIERTSVFDYLTEESVKKAVDSIQKMYTSDSWGTEEFMGLREDGTTFNLEINAGFIRNDKGELENLVFVSRDITERKKTEELLLRNEEKYRALFDQSGEAFLILDGLKIIECNKASEKLFNLERSDIINKTPIDFSPQYQSAGQYSEDKAKELISETLKTGQMRLEWLYIGISEENEKAIMTADVSMAVMNYNNRKLIHVAIRDITKQKEINTRLRTLERAVEQSPVSIVITNTDGNIEYVNPKTIEVTGYTKEELINKNPRLLQSGETSSSEYKEIWHSIETGKTWKGLFLNKKKNGDLYWESSTISPVFDDKAKITHYVAIKEDITDQKKAQQELIKFRTISEKANYGTAIVDLQGILLYINESFAQMHGYEAEKLTGKPILFLHSKNKFDTVNEILIEASEKRAVSTKEVWHMKSDGTEFPTLMNVSLIENEKGEPAFYAITAIDITEKKKTEEFTRLQNIKLNAIVDAIPDLIFVLTEDGTYEDFYASGSVKRKHLKKDDIIGRNIKDVFTPDDVAIHLAKIKACLETNNLVTYEYSLNINNADLNFETRLVPISSNKVLSFVRDITEAKKDFATINRLSLAVTQSPVAVVVTDLEGNIVFVNPAFTKITGFSSDEIMGENARILKSGKNDPQIYVELWETIAAGKVWKKEWINKKKNNDYYWELVSISPLFNEKGKIINYLAIKQDITQRKKTLQEITDLNRNLEKKVSERTTEIVHINQSLRLEIEERSKAEKTLREKSDELEKFFGVTLDLLCIANTNGEFVKVNKAWQSTLGFSIEQLENNKFTDYVHPDDIKFTMEAVEQLKNQLQVANFTNRYRTNDGSYKYIEWRSTPVGDKIYSAARDITERKRKEDFELELLDLSSRIAILPHSEIQTALDMALSRIGKFLNADRAYIFEINKENDTLTNTYEWCNEGIEPQKHLLVNIACNLFPESLKKLRNNENIIISSISDLPSSWQAEKEIFESQKIQSLSIIPLIHENELIGFVGLDMVSKPREYNVSEINILNIWGSILNGLLSNHYTDQMLELSRQNFEIFFNTVGDFLTVSDEKGNIVHVNNTVLERLEYNYDELIGQSCLIMHPATRYEEASSVFAKMLAGETDFCILPIVSKGGTSIPVETRIKTGNWNGKPAIFGVSKDISKLELSEQKFSKAFESGSAMMAISDLETGEYIDVNKTYLETLGYERNELIGESAKMQRLFVDEELRERIVDNLNANKNVRDLEIEVRTKNNTIKTVLMSAETIMIGETNCLLTIGVDISSRKNAEEELKSARIEAEQANLAKSEFLSRMSHELRTPMNSILGFAQLLEMSELNNSQSRGVGHILRSGKHLLGLINEVLDISRIESGGLSLSMESIKLNTVIEEIIDVMLPLAISSDIHIEFQDTDTKNFYVNADRQRLNQILLNLLDNAIKYNRPHGLVNVSCKKSSNGKNIRISVTDNGLGIPSHNLIRIFEPFERIGADKTDIEGTGLGLTVVKKLVTALGGTVGVTSKLDEGSTFWFELEQGLNLNEVIAENKPKDKKRTVGSTTVLCVEDNELNSILIEQVIESQRPSIKLVIEKYGLKAAELAQKVAPNLILLDMNLPDIHGSEVLKILKTDPITRHIPVVVISADALTKQIQQVMQQGAEKYLTKPLDINKLLEVLDLYTM